MPIFKVPQYSKITNPKTGVQEQCYTFKIEFQTNEESISFLTDSPSEITLQSLQKCIIDNIEWWCAFIVHFLKETSKLFSKPYTVEHINKITKHTLDGIIDNNKFPVNVILVPKTIQISGGCFIVNWGYTLMQVAIDIPDLTDIQENQLPVSNKHIENEVQELNIDDLPVSNNCTEDVLDIDSPAKFYEKQMVKETRLKAKLAVYKAQRQMTKYYEKYGDDISDSDYDTSDNDSGEDSEKDV